MSDADLIQGVTRGAIQRMARRAGITRVGGLAYEEIRGGILQWMQTLADRTVTALEFSGRRTVSDDDVRLALRQMDDDTIGVQRRCLNRRKRLAPL